MSSLRQQAYHYIRNGMATGTFAVGDRLSPAALAKQIGISHIPVREAISQLHSEGLVEQLPRRGAFVRQPTREELVELIELRKTLECNAAAQAAKQIGDAEIANLERSLKDLRGLLKEGEKISSMNPSITDPSNVGDDIRPSDDELMIDFFARWQFIDFTFHMTILRAARNRWVIKVLGDTNALTQLFGYRSDRPENWGNLVNFTLENYKVHAEIFSAIRSHDPKAARQAMVQHMRRARRNMLSRFDWLHEQKHGGNVSVEEYPQSLLEKLNKAQEFPLGNEQIKPETGGH